MLTAGSISGDNFDISGVPHGLLRPIQSQAPSAPWLFPTPDIWGDKVCNKLFTGNCCSTVCCLTRAPWLAYMHRLHPAVTWWVDMLFVAGTDSSFLQLHEFKLHPADAINLTTPVGTTPVGLCSSTTSTGNAGSCGAVCVDAARPACCRR